MKNISLILSILGIFILLLLLKFQEPEKLSINEAKSKEINSKLSIEGKIIDLRIVNEDNFTISKIKDNSGYIEMICNCPDLKNFKNQTLLISGYLSEYKGNMQIQANKIKVKDK
jgi:DNA/RNA endonuclease YhcR with UshA esterase domain